MSSFERLAIALPLRDQIDVAIRPSQRGMHLAARVQCDCDATDDAERHAPGRCQIADAQGLGGHVRVGARIHRANVREIRGHRKERRFRRRFRHIHRRRLDRRSGGSVGSSANVRVAIWGSPNGVPQAAPRERGSLRALLRVGRPRLGPVLAEVPRRGTLLRGQRADHGRRPHGQGDRAHPARRRRRVHGRASSARRGAGAAEEPRPSCPRRVRYNGMYPWVASRTRSHSTATRSRPGRAVRARSCSTSCDAGSSSPRRAHGRSASRSSRWRATTTPGLRRGPRARRAIISCDLRIVEVGGHEMISCSYANPTPWASPRELDRGRAVRPHRGLADQLERPGSAIFNLHVPPYDSGLDTRHRDRRPAAHVVREGGSRTRSRSAPRPCARSSRSTSRCSPLHGHIHESRGAARRSAGRSPSTPGSEYTTGRIHGAIVKLA